MKPSVSEPILQDDARAPFSAGDRMARAVELDRLLASIAPVFSGRFAGVVYVDGEAGFGKSHLVESARRRLEARAAPFLWIEAPCDPTLQRSLNAFEVALEDRFQQSSAADEEENLARFDRLFDELVGCVPAADEAFLDGASGSDPSPKPPPPAEALRWEILAARSMYTALLGHRVPGSPYARLRPKERFDRTLAALAAWVRAESMARPVILHLEDAHWADGDTLRAVQAIARISRSEAVGRSALPVARHVGLRSVSPGLPVAIVCTARSTDDGAPFRILLDADVPVHDIGLAPLPAEDIGRIAENAIGRPLPDAVRRALVEGAGGNPFLAEEIAASWSHDADLHAQAPGHAEPLPPRRLAPADILAAQLDRLPARVKLTVLGAAVLGKQFDLRVLTAMSGGDPEVKSHVRTAVAQRIFIEQPPGRFGFRTTSLRDAAYAAQGRDRLARMHLLAAQTIETIHQGELDRHHATLGRHYRRAGMPGKARPYFLSAARQAAARYALAEARRWYDSYFKLVDVPTAESALARYERARDVHEPRGDFSRALDEHSRVIEEAQMLGDGALETLGRLGLGRVALALGHSDEARVHLLQVLADASRARQRRTEALALAHLALVHRTAGLTREACETFDRALRLGLELGMHEDATAFGDMVARVRSLPPAASTAQDILDALVLYEQTTHTTLRHSHW